MKHWIFINLELSNQELIPRNIFRYCLNFKFKNQGFFHEYVSINLPLALFLTQLLLFHFLFFFFFLFAFSSFAKENAFSEIIGSAIGEVPYPLRRFIRISYCYSTPLSFMGLFRSKGWSSNSPFLSWLHSSRLKRIPQLCISGGIL